MLILFIHIDRCRYRMGDVTTNDKMSDVTTNDSGLHSRSIDSSATGTPNVADADFNRSFRIATLYVIVVLGTVGGALAILWLWAKRKRPSRVNKIIMHVVTSDLLVILCACLPQLVWEYYDREWYAGPFFCKALKFVSSFAMIASNYMLVLLSLDRHIAVMYPMRTQPKVRLHSHFSIRIESRKNEVDRQQALNG